MPYRPNSCRCFFSPISNSLSSYQRLKTHICFSAMSRRWLTPSSMKSLWPWLRVSESSYGASAHFRQSFEEDALAEIQKVGLKSRWLRKRCQCSGRAKKFRNGSTPALRYQNHWNGLLGVADRGCRLVVHSFLLWGVLIPTRRF